MRMLIVFLAGLFWCNFSSAQELFILTEPASNMPSKSIGLRLNNYIMPAYTNPVDGLSHGPTHRINPELMWGINKNLMVHFNVYASNMQQPQWHFEGAGIYAKYRFLSIDNSKRHFRMALYGKGSLIDNPINYDELNPGGDNSGFSSGIVATQLLHKLAISFTGGYIRSMNNLNHTISPGQPRDALNLSLSAGYLLFPFKYKNYDQPNLNIYAECLTKINPATGQYFIDFAPGVQLIFKSRMRLDFAYRRQLSGDIFRINNQEFIVKFEYNIFNAYGNRVKDTEQL